MSKNIKITTITIDSKKFLQFSTGRNDNNNNGDSDDDDIRNWGKMAIRTNFIHIEHTVSALYNDKQEIFYDNIIKYSYLHDKTIKHT